MDENYERIILKIAGFAGLEREEIERRVEAKRAKLSGLISREGAAQVIAAELGFKLDDQKLKIHELLPGMRRVNTLGKIISISPIRTFKTRSGEESKVTNLILADETSNVKVVLWDTNHILLIEKGEISVGSVVEINNGSMRDGEVHLGSLSKFCVSEERMENVVAEKVVREKTISELRVGDSALVRAFIVQAFEPRFFYVCTTCKKKAVSGEGGFFCNEHGKIEPEKRVLFNFVVDDGTGTIRTVVFHENALKMGLNSFENQEVLLGQKQNLLGGEFYFFGEVRNNSYFNNPELIVNDVKKVDLDELLQKLEEENKK